MTETRIELNFAKMFGGDLEKYLDWAITNTAEIIVTNPKEYKITLAIYDLHKTVLKNSGYDIKKIEEGDNRLAKLVESKLKVKFELNKSVRLN